MDINVHISGHYCPHLDIFLYPGNECLQLDILRDTFPSTTVLQTEGVNVLSIFQWNNSSNNTFFKVDQNGPKAALHFLLLEGPFLYLPSAPSQAICTAKVSPTMPSTRLHSIGLAWLWYFLYLFGDMILNSNTSWHMFGIDALCSQVRLIGVKFLKGRERGGSFTSVHQFNLPPNQASDFSCEEAAFQ